MSLLEYLKHEDYQIAESVLSQINLCDLILPSEEYMRFIGSSNKKHYLENMATIFYDLCKRCKFDKDIHVLDIGCGCGRLTIPIKELIKNGSGKYYGIDIWEQGINFCNKNYINNQCSFKHIVCDDPYYCANEMTNKKNTFDLSHIPKNSIDRVFAISVFSHLNKKDTNTYFAEMNKITNQKVIMYLSFFLIDEYYDEYLKDNEGYYLNEIESGVWKSHYTGQYTFFGFSYNVMNKLLEDNGFKVVEYLPGKWCNKPYATQWQDVFIVNKV